jgi:hypothetical protein
MIFNARKTPHETPLRPWEERGSMQREPVTFPLSVVTCFHIEISIDSHGHYHLETCMVALAIVSSSTSA